MDPAQLFTNLSIAFILGYFIVLLCSWLPIPDILLLLLLGLGMSVVTYPPLFPMSFDMSAVLVLATLASILVTFNGALGLKFQLLDENGLKMANFVFWFTLVTLLVVSPLLHYLAGLPWGVSAILAAILTGASPLVSSIFSKVKNKSVEFLTLEGLTNPSLDFLLALMLIDAFYKGAQTKLVVVALDQLKFFLMKFIIGIGAGVFVALILYKALNARFHPFYSPFGLLVGLIASYAIAEGFGGSGILAVAVVSIMLSNLPIQKTEQHLLPQSIVMKAVSMLVVVALGSMMHIPRNPQFFLTAGIIVSAFFLIRILLAWMIFSEVLMFRQQLTFALSSPKGYAAVIIMLLLLDLQVPMAQEAFAYMIFFIFFNALLACIVAALSQIAASSRR
ncbi:cation:proton antiporter [Candidatus Woesearchaeota archaeon]|nr:cation:proton antiporter [Candidatus Woesearchaeota archaeon]